MLDNGPDTSIQSSEPLHARTRILADSVANSDPSQTPTKQEGEGFRQLRDQATKIREEVRRQKEREEAEAAANGARVYVSARTKGRPRGTKE